MLQNLIIQCSECGAKFRVPKHELGKNGRFVHCSICRHEWLAELPRACETSIDKITQEIRFIEQCKTLSVNNNHIGLDNKAGHFSWLWTLLFSLVTVILICSLLIITNDKSRVFVYGYTKHFLNYNKCLVVKSQRIDEVNKILKLSVYNTCQTDQTLYFILATLEDIDGSKRGVPISIYKKILGSREVQLQLELPLIFSNYRKKHLVIEAF